MWEGLLPQVTVKRLGFGLGLSQGTGLRKSRAKRIPKSPGEYAKRCIKEAKAQLAKSFALEFKQKNVRIDMLNGCKERDSSSRSPGLRISP